MLAFSIIFYLLVLIASLGAGTMLWKTVLQKFFSGTTVCTQPSPIELAIVGLLAIGVLVVFPNFFVPISQWLSVLVLTACLITGIVNLVGASKPRLHEFLALTSIVVLFAIWGSKFMLAYDAGLYHLQAISWIKDEPIVIGLANIHDRFGFNSFWFSVMAVFWLPFFEAKGVLLANYLPAILVLFMLVHHLLYTSKSGAKTFSTSTTFALFCLVSFSAAPSIFLTTTTSTDLAPNVYTLLSALIFLRGFDSSKYSTAELTKDFMLLWVIAIFSVLVKLNSITPSILALIFTWYHKDVLSIFVIRRIAFFLFIVTFFWLLRNFFLSGCLIFPVGFTCADSNLIGWSIGPDNAEMMKLIVERWAKAPGADFILNGTSRQWFDLWLITPDRGLQLTYVARKVAYSSFIVLLFLTLLYIFQKKTTRHDFSNRRPLVGAGFTMLAALLGLAFGFITAPDPRFWWGSLITILILPAAIAPYLFFKYDISIGARSIFAVILLAVFTAGNYALVRGPSWQVITQPNRIYQTIIPEIQTNLGQFTGVDINMPKAGDRCWLAPKPCSPPPHINLVQSHIGPYTVFIRKMENMTLK